MTLRHLRIRSMQLGAALALAAAALAAGSPGASAQSGAPAAAVVSSAAPVANQLRVTLGHSIFIDTRARLRKVYIADPAVLSSLTLSPTRILVTGMAPGVTSLTLLDEAGTAQSFVVSCDVDTTVLRAAMDSQMKDSPVHVEANAGRVTLTGSVASQEQADAAVKLAGLYAKDVASALVVAPQHARQVRLKVRILEVDRGKLLQLGVNLFSPTGYNTTASSTSALFPSAATASAATSSSAAAVAVSNPLNFVLYNFTYNIGASIQDLQTKQVLQILAEPTITTISGEKANFLSGGEFPFPVVQPGSGVGSAPVVSISFRPFGVKLEFTPVVNPDGTIRLKVAPEVSALDYTNAVSISGITVPALSTRRAETEVELRSDQSFAISGLLDQRTSDVLSKNPGAASIPILGALFKSKNQNHSTTELVVVVTPTVVDPLDEPADPAQPGLPIEPLNRGGFDKSLGRDLNPDPQPPAPRPGEPFGSPAPAATSPTPSSPSAAAPAAE